MAHELSDYFQTPFLFREAIRCYEKQYIDNSRRDWALTGRNGKFTAYTLAEQLFDVSVEIAARLHALGEILSIVQSWNGDSTKPGEMRKYGESSAILDNIDKSGNEFRRGNMTLASLTAEHYHKLVHYLGLLKVVKSNGNYPHIPVSKFLHIINPCLFPIYDDRNIWYKLIAPESSKPAGVFSNDYITFCRSAETRGLPLFVTMTPVDWTANFNANYTYWARKHMTQASPDLMPYFAEWLNRNVSDVPDPYSLKSNANIFYGLAFEIVALGAGCLESIID